MGMSSSSVRKCNICKGDNVQLMEGGEYHIGHTYEWECLDCGITYLHEESVERLDLDEVNIITNIDNDDQCQDNLNDDNDYDFLLETINNKIRSTRKSNIVKIQEILKGIDSLKSTLKI